MKKNKHVVTRLKLLQKHIAKKTQITLAFKKSFKSFDFVLCESTVAHPSHPAAPSHLLPSDLSFTKAQHNPTKFGQNRAGGRGRGKGGSEVKGKLVVLTRSQRCDPAATAVFNRGFDFLIQII